MNNMHRFCRVPAAAGVALLLAACGGGGGEEVSSGFVSGTDVPTSATATAQGATSFVRTTASSNADTAEPAVLGNAELATSETAEPDPV
jgi:hypothetical protein